jgi:nucleotide-binding universal stress UspA family protein
MGYAATVGMANTKSFPIVVAVDFSELADRALQAALELSQTHPNAELHVIAVGNEDTGAVLLPGPALRVLPQKEAEAETCKHVDEVVKNFAKAHGPVGVERIAVYVTSGYPAERIVALAGAVDAELIVLGTHGRTGFKRIALGSVAEEVVRRAPCTVHVVRPRDFLEGEKLPAIDPPLHEGEHALRQFEHRRTYHYVTRDYSTRTMPVL